MDQKEINENVEAYFVWVATFSSSSFQQVILVFVARAQLSRSINLRFEL
jgi:hypothetical protein